MTARTICAAAMAALVLNTSSAWGQYEQPRNGSSPQARRNPAPRANTKEQFQFSEDTDLPAAAPADRGAPRRAGEIRPVAGQSPIRQPGERPTGNARPGNQPNPGAGAIIPRPWEPLPPDEQRALDDLMKAWEQHSSKIERYECNFERWEFDPIFGPKDPTQAKTYGKGKLLYAAPDKGKFQVESLSVRIPEAKPEEKQWVERPTDDIGEHWVCDGKRIFAFDAKNKKLIVQELPPAMQGKAIVDGPLPFLFGAKVATIEARYWLRLITPANVQKEQWIEAVPKHAADAKNFKMVQVIIDETDFLPKAIQVFDPGFDAKERPIRTVYTFNNRRYNWNITLQQINIFNRWFYEPKTPYGWTKVDEPFFPAPGQQPPAAAAKPNPLKLPFKQR